MRSGALRRLSLSHTLVHDPATILVVEASHSDLDGPTTSI